MSANILVKNVTSKKVIITKVNVPIQVKVECWHICVVEVSVQSRDSCFSLSLCYHILLHGF